MKKILIYAFISLITAGCEVLNIHTITCGIHKGDEGIIAAGAIAFVFCIMPLVTSISGLIRAIKQEKYSKSC